MRTDNDEQFDALLRGADPVRTEALPDPDGPAALRIRTQARQRSRRGRLRRLVVIPAVSVLVVGGATAGALTVFGDGHASTQSVECYSDAGLQGTSQLVNSQISPEQACAEMGDLPEADQLTACAPSDGPGGARVYEGGLEVCEEHDLVAYTGPSDEQRRLGLFRTAVWDEFGNTDCPPLPEVRTTLNELLHEHQLDSWTVREGGAHDFPEVNVMEGFGRAPGGGAGSVCFALAYLEEERVVALDYQ